MDHPKLPDQEKLKALLSQEQFLMMIVDQLNKDLGSRSDAIKMPDSDDVAGHIHHQLSKTLAELDREPGNRLQELMYRVDVPSKQYFKILGEANSSAMTYNTLADAILNREMQKVWFRMNYKP